MSAAASPDEIKQASGKLASHFGGYAATWTIDLGARVGMFAALRDAPAGLTSTELARLLEADQVYVDVWCRNAYAAELLEQSDGRYILPPAMAALLLDRDHPAYSSGTAMVMTALRDVFVALRERTRTGERIWWDTAPREFVDGVAESSRSFYSRLLTFFDGRQELRQALEGGGTLLEVGVGYGGGLLRLAQRFPAARFIGTDGDEHSLGRAREAFAQAGLADRARFVRSTFEAYDEAEVADLALINISLHEARDLPRTIASMRRALRPGGRLVVSEFPFPPDVTALRTPPARVMAAIQYFEASIGDQLLPTSAFVKLLEEAGLHEIETIEITPVHVVILGRRSPG